ncbi:MAG TPA: hypothetical protein VM074_12850 [Solimonas sp.]|nr:hypothetical protein [Solimonas sp.]
MARSAKAPAHQGLRHTSFLAFGDFRWLRFALALCSASIAAYLLYDPVHGHSGDTWLGYTLGTVGALLIVWLAWYGVRKRRYVGGRGPMQALTSAHVYLGLSLAVVGTLHTGFRLGWNVHTLAWVLMLLVIASGIYGIVAYSVLPRRISANRTQATPASMQAEIARLDQLALRLADKIDPETHEVVSRSVSGVQIGGSVRQQLAGKYARRGTSTIDEFLQRKRGQLETQARLGPATQPSAAMQALAARQAELAASGQEGGTIAFVADQIFEAGRSPDAEALHRLLSAISQRKVLVERLNRDITQRARLNIWLFVHVPLTVALLAALIVHIVSSFFYW